MSSTSANVSSDPSDCAEAWSPAPFIYIKIPVAVRPADRDLDKVYALDQALRQRRLGSVIGWGDSLGGRQPDGSRPVAFLRIDVEVGDLTLMRAALQELLPALGAPSGTEVHYTRDRRSLQDVLAPSGWRLEEPVA